MTFAKLLENPVLLSESTAVPVSWIVEHEPRLVKNGYFVGILKLTTLVPSDDGLVDESAIAREIFYNCNTYSVLVLVEDNTMPVRDGIEFQLAIYCQSVFGMIITVVPIHAYRTLDASR